MTLHRVAHRGYSAAAPENTLPALGAAVLAGATFVEFDVRTTADGVPVVIHDRSIERTTDGAGFVWERTVEEMRALDAGSWFSPAYAGVRVPLLTEVLDLLTPPDALSDEADKAGVTPHVAHPELLMEIKSPATAAEVKVILEMVGEVGLLGRTVVQSFDPDVVALAREAAPDVRRGLLRLRMDEETVALAVGLGVTYCNPPVRDLPRFGELMAAGIEVMPWTANDMTQWPTLVAAGVAGLITDRTGELTGWCAGR
jgi:glycerophosphoryl diester phosphodiesterase